MNGIKVRLDQCAFVMIGDVWLRVARSQIIDRCS
jgi:hypothetical protein